MPTRSLTSSALTWPDRATVDPAVRTWAQRIATLRPEVLRIGYFGSYARGDAGVGSDLDIIAIVERAPSRAEERILGWDAVSLPVPVDLLVYTVGEWATVSRRGRFGETLIKETAWVYERGPQLERRTHSAKPATPRPRPRPRART